MRSCNGGQLCLKSAIFAVSTQLLVAQLATHTALLTVNLNPIFNALPFLKTVKLLRKTFALVALRAVKLLALPSKHNNFLQVVKRAAPCAHYINTKGALRSFFLQSYRVVKLWTLFLSALLGACKTHALFYKLFFGAAVRLHTRFVSAFL